MNVCVFRESHKTILGSTASPKEFFMIYKCEDIFVSQVANKINVELRNVKPVTILSDYRDKHVYFCNKSYDPKTGAFEDISPNSFTPSQCDSCMFAELQDIGRSVILGEVLTNTGHNVTFSHCFYKGMKVEVNRGVLLRNDAYPLVDYLKTYFKAPTVETDYDAHTYTEKYRKQLSDVTKGSLHDVPEPYLVGLVEEISAPTPDASLRDISLTVRKLLRPQNVFKDFEKIVAYDLNSLFYTFEEVCVKLSDVIELCNLYHSSCDEMGKSFVINEKCVRINGEWALSPLNEHITFKTDTPRAAVNRKLRAFDLFAGCGGLALGFERSGVAQSCWAIEKDKAAADSFKANFPEAIVFEDDVNVLLDLILNDRQRSPNDLKLPRKGEVDLILAGPPCQGFSGMNRFSSGQYSLFKNSLIVTLLGYVDYYRPDFVVIENVRNFFKFKKSMVLKLTVACLLRMHYQVRFAVLQAGFYGVPQARKRALIVAAAPGKTLPPFPAPLTCFPARCAQPSIKVDDVKYYHGLPSTGLCRALTVWDAVGDLRDAKPAETIDDTLTYDSAAVTTYQKSARSGGVRLRDHVCKQMGALSMARIERIPMQPGADWRDLPNVAVTLADGRVIKKLQYAFKDVKTKDAAGDSDGLRGVCACASDRDCNSYESRQENTLIPWCLVHTAHKNYQWSGLYGRLDWHGYFPTTVTNPEPISKQGLVLHPAQHRVMSVRELARSQGFPDDFTFCGTVMERYRQVFT